MSNQDRSPLKTTSPNLADGEVLVSRIIEGAGNYLAELDDADDEYAERLLADLGRASEVLGVNW
jgi:hypothetical protein